ncbi:hypothetical protein GCM10010123_09840 [Pilimelia anulata]|uniref:Uncharacterized protein n=1 Tax=Pilimelia anulata TaxID=53371 RepID=A0A8J3B0T1_9ACTN|nr:hypothetical protein GCM10010123_09840 [Pilimelia anulata]
MTHANPPDAHPPGRSAAADTGDTLDEPAGHEAPASPLTGPEKGPETAMPHTPVFVDSTGRRRRRLARTAYLFGVLSVAYLVFTAMSAFGGSVTPGGPPADPGPGISPTAPRAVPSPVVLPGTHR